MLTTSRPTFVGAAHCAYIENTCLRILIYLSPNAVRDSIPTRQAVVTSVRLLRTADRMEEEERRTSTRMAILLSLRGVQLQRSCLLFQALAVGVAV